jgi:hypothetical protein
VNIKTNIIAALAALLVSGIAVGSAVGPASATDIAGPVKIARYA